jgi:peptidoglycan/xylan/chitin deacetylase (PgdA/CDA1 family)
VAVTFDGGSIDNATQEILDILKEKQIKSTFFLTGEFIRSYPKTVKRIVAEGHEVGNHTWSHPHLTAFAKDKKQTTLPNMTQERIRDELSKTASIFKLVTGREMVHLWRAPYGEYNQEILRWAAEAGYKHVGWTVGKGWEETMDTMDWVADKNSSAYRSADAIAGKILDFSKKGPAGASGTIILMHLGTNRTDDFPHKKLPDIIAGLQKNGYKLVTISEMAEGQ